MRRTLSGLTLAAAGLLILAACGTGPSPRTSADASRDIDAINPSLEDALFIGAGDIARCSHDQLANAHATGDLIRTFLARFPDTKVFTTGDNAYEDGTASEFQSCYNPTWGSFNEKTAPSPGNHDYHTPGATPYFDYFSFYATNPAAKARGFYSFDFKDWHIISLNSNIAMGQTSPQIAWLNQDLETTSKRCILAFWHHPLFSSGRHGSQPHDPGRNTGDLWEALERHGADVIVNGHDHDYERFALQDSTSSPTSRGIREFVIGTGGAELRPRASSQRNSEFFDASHHGILVLTLHPTSYDWAFVGIDGRVLDQSSDPVPCHED
jgi:hypothetical protein